MVCFAHVTHVFAVSISATKVGVCHDFDQLRDIYYGDVFDICHGCKAIWSRFNVKAYNPRGYCKSVFYKNSFLIIQLARKMRRLLIPAELNFGTLFNYVG